MIRVSVVVSYIVVSYFGENLLKQNLPPLIHMAQETNSEIIVVDNGSPPSVVDYLNSLQATASGVLRILLLSDNAGFGPANNYGARKARGRYLCFMNNDARWRTVEDARMAVSTLEEQDSVVGIGPQLVNPGGSLQPSGSHLPSLVGELIIASRLYRLWTSNPYKQMRTDYTVTRRVDSLPAACLLVRAQDFSAIGGFDENIFLYYEDHDLCKRLASRGHLVYLPQAQAIHAWGQSATADWIREVGRDSQLYYFWKHHGVGQMRILQVLLGFFEMIAIPMLFVRYALRKSVRMSKIRLHWHLLRRTLMYRPSHKGLIR